ncbi:hypothetical protein SMSP2_02037 [Limihaloglobus sulfuriphilus]|uniref:DUF4190 domain-containing protein n=1 Tax=Limihaloglobus sulfuriphilus TaxID=1851148 RepID=A0A1Q2MG54_9BACT|nr:DUF4190 domain-containing protein [Limihaloglobus sulfuriphilus]AQQ71660.1 hypothetical protein SMSP2_02037 [Limihaloglobus sulfuriphilus]
MESIELEPKPQKNTLKLSIISMILGVLSLVFFVLFIPFLDFLLAISGLIAGIIALRKIKKSAGIFAGRGFAIAGIVTSSISFLRFILFIVFMFLVAFPSGLKDRDPQSIIEDGRLAQLPESAFGVKAEGWSSMFTGDDYMMFKADPEDIEKFIADSPSLKGIEPELFSPEKQYMPYPEKDDFETDQEFLEHCKHSYYHIGGHLPYRWSFAAVV